MPPPKKKLNNKQEMKTNTQQRDRIAESAPEKGGGKKR
jgi:hypothetical protein